MDTKPTVPCRRITCPKCGHEPAFLSEVWDGGTLDFDYANGMRGEEGIRGEGAPVKVIAHCDCGHGWTLRGVVQITELDR